MNEAKIDAVLNATPSPDEVLYDIVIGPDGDILTEDQLDTAIVVSLFTDARAEAHEIVKPQMRRGWVGDLEDGSIGSKLWLLEQERLTLAVLARASDYAEKALEWLVDDQIAVSVVARAYVQGGDAVLDVDLKKPNSRTEARFVGLWENTGR